jgi:trans-feruloyl-CoA hydratase/vanillin synthase
MGQRKALYWALTGENFDAFTAERDGLVTRTVAQDTLGMEVDRLAELLAGKSPVALDTIKQIYREARGVGMEGIHAYVNGKLDEMRARDGGAREQGMADFIGKKLRTTT